MTDKPSSELPPARLRWACRRGMRELDVLLERYLQQHWSKASLGQREAFESLLVLNDPDLAALCLGNADVPVQFVELIAVLRGVLGALPAPPDSMGCPSGAPTAAKYPASELIATSAVYSGDRDLRRLPGSDQ